MKFSQVKILCKNVTNWNPQISCLVAGKFFLSFREQWPPRRTFHFKIVKRSLYGELSIHSKSACEIATSTQYGFSEFSTQWPIKVLKNVQTLQRQIRNALCEINQNEWEACEVVKTELANVFMTRYDCVILHRYLSNARTNQKTPCRITLKKWKHVKMKLSSKKKRPTRIIVVFRWWL